MRILLVIALLVSVTSGALWAQTADPRASRADVIRLLGQLPEFSPIREEFQALGYEGENLELAVKQAELLYRDPVLAGYLADRLIEAFESPQSVRAPDGLITGLIRNGLGHLSTSELRYYYRVEQIMLQSLPTRTCGRAVKDRLSPAKFSELVSRMAAGFSPKSLREYYRVQAKAARFGATRKPVRQGREKSAAVEERVNARLAQKISQRSDQRQLLAAVGNLDRARNKQACQIGRLFMETVMELKGRELRDTLIYMSQP